MARTKEFDKNDILDKAIALFSSKGYNGASMEDVLAYLGISRSSLYDTFGDKRQLYIAALNRYREQASGSLIALVDNSTETIPTLKKIFAGLVKISHGDELFKGCFMINTTVELAPHDKEINDIINGNMLDVEDAFFRLIKKGQSRGDVNTDNTARAVARFLFNTISGLRVAAKAGVDKKVFDDIVKVVLASVSPK